MAYFAPFIDASGLHIPTYQDILDYFISNAKAIFGQDIYLGQDSADYQILSIQALAYSDAMQSLQQEYNNRSPQTAIGAALDSLLKINGISRKANSYSMAILTLTGTPNLTIKNAVASDINGVKWLIPQITFDNTGAITVLATCANPGAVAAASGTINTIATPVLGWFSVTNQAAAIVGTANETDAIARSRQAVSTQLASQTLLAGTKAAIAALSGIGRFEVYENDTAVADANGIPAHTVCAVVEGASDYDIAQTIYSNKSEGCGTYGTSLIIVSDPVNSYSNTIKFFRPTYVEIYNTINIHPLVGWNDGMLLSIQTAVVNYINSLKIGQSVTVLTGILSAVLSVLPDSNNPAFSVRVMTAGTAIGAQATADIAIAFNSVAQTDAAKVVVAKV